MAQYNHPSARNVPRFEQAEPLPKQLPIPYPHGGAGGHPHTPSSEQPGGTQVWVPPNPYLYTGEISKAFLLTCLTGSVVIHLMQWTHI